MGKRALSLFLAVLLCVSMLPTAVFADTSGTFETVETITAVAETAERETGTDKTTEETEVPPTEEDGTGIAELAADEAAVSVTKSNGTDGGTFTSLPAALNAAQNGDTVKLLANHTTNWSDVEAGEEQMAVVKTRITLDLNGNTVDYLVVGEVVPDEEGGILESTDGNLTVQSSQSGGTAMNGQITTLKFVQGTLSVQDRVIIGSSSSSTGLICEADSGTVTISGGIVYNATVGEGAAVTVSGGSMHQGQWINNGTLNITGGTFGRVEFYNNSGTIAISGGTFNTLRNYDNKSEWPIAPMPLLAPGHAFYDIYDENTVKDGSSRGYLQNVTVKEHTHTFENGKCACGYVCTHTKDGTSAIENGKCTVCNAAFVAMVTVGDTITYHADIADALEAAKDNGTVKIIAAENTLKLPDKNGYPVLFAEGTLTIDLNGHTLSGGGLMVGGYIGTSSNTRTGNLTVIDSVGGGKIDGEVTGLKVQPGAKVKFDGQATTACCKLAVYSHASRPAEAKFSGGIIYEVATLSDVTYADLLADGYCFYDYSSSTLGEPIKLETLKNQTKVTTPLAVAACSHPEAGEDGKCLYCGLKLAVRDSNGTIYDTLQAAIDAAVSDSSIQWLMLDADITGNVTFDAAGKTVTVNMNGRKLTSANGIPLTVKNGTLTIEGEAYIDQTGETKDASDCAVSITGGELIFKGALTAQGGSSTEKASPAIAVTGGKVTFADKVTATGGLQGIHGNAMTCQPAVYATSGELDFQGDLDLNGGLTVTDSAKLTNGLSNGVFRVEYDEAVDARCISVEGSKNYKNLNALLADGYAFVNKANESKFPCTSASMTFWTGNVKIVKHTHTWEQGNGDLYSCTVCSLTCDHTGGFSTGKCEVCGMPCPHAVLDSTDSRCEVCKQTMVARIMTKNNEGYDLLKHYASLADAINHAADGSTITVVAKDNQLSLPYGIYVKTESKGLTLDLNGHSLSGYSLNVGGLTTTSQVRTGKLTVIDSSGGNGAVGVTVRNGGTLVFNPENDNTTLLQLEVYGGTVALYGGKISRSGLRLNNGITLGDLLPGNAGLAYYRGDTQLTLEEAASQTCDLVVKSCSHGGKNGFDKNATTCPYCNAPAVAETALNNREGGFLWRRFADLQTAIDADRAGSAEFKLLTDVTGDYTINGTQNTALDLNGHSIEGTVTVKAAAGRSTTLSNTKNTTTVSIDKVVAYKGAKLAGSKYPAVIGTLTLAEGATWKNILNDTALGYKVLNADGTHKWYAPNDVNDSQLQLNNVIINRLPITSKTLNLKVDGKNLTGSSPKVGRGTTVQLCASCNAKDVTVTFSILKTGETTPITLTEPSYAGGKYTKDYSFDTIGEYTIYFTATKDGYTVQSSHKKLTVTKPNLSNAEITFPDGNEAAFNYVTATGVPTFIVTCNGKKLKKGVDFTIAGGDSFSGVGSCTLTIKATDNGDYTGSKSADWKVRPLKVAVSVGDIIKTYDGTTDLSANAKITFKSADSYYTGATLRLAKSTDYEVLNAHYDSADAGEEEKTISFTIKLKNEGYVFEDGMTQKDVTLNGSETDKTFKINKAALPTGYIPDNGGLIIKNGVAHTYTYDVSKLLKELPNGLNYGTTSYELESIGSVDNGYIEDGTVSISENGMLTVPVKAVNTVAPSEIAIVKVKVTMQNYSDITIPVTVYARNRIVPTGEPTLDKNEITYGDKISSIELSGIMHDDTNNVDVEGTFAWNAPDTAPGAGNYEAEWTFTPNDVMYAPATGTATIKVNKATLVEGVDYETPTAVTGLVYRVNDNTPQALHTSGRVIGTVGTMKYTTDNPESAAAVWSDTPLTSRDAGEFVVYYKVFGDENHLDSAYGTLRCRIAKCKLVYKIVCLPKVYDGTKNGDPKNIESITFLDEDSKTVKVDLTEQDYTIDSITYDSQNVGENLGTVPVSATAVVTLRDTKTANNYELAVDGNKACGCITPARIEGVDFHGYTHKVRYIDTYAKTITVSCFGDVNRADYEIVSDMVSAGDSRIIRKINCDTSGITFAIADGLSTDDIGKSYTIKVRIYTKDHNYCTDELPFTVEIADKDRPTLSVEPIEVTYNGKAVPESSINGTATVDGSRIDGTWNFKDGKAPTTVAESGDYTVVFTPTYPDYYYGGEETVHVTVKPRDIGDNAIAFPSGDSFVYTGKSTIPYIYGEYKYDENKEALELLEERDYTLTYPEDTTNVGEKKITVTGRGNFGGTKELIYTITPCTLKPTITLSETDYIYDGKEKKPTVTVTVEDRTLVEGKDFEVAYENNTYAEDGAKVTVTAKGNYGFDKQEVPFHIGKANAVIETAPGASPFIYDGSSHALVTAGSAAGGSFEYKLGDGNWTTAVPTAENAAEYTVWYRVIGDSNHNNTAESSVTVTVGRRDIADAKITLGSSLTYNRKEQTQTVSSVVCGDRLNATFTVTDNRKTNAGTYTLTVAGTGNFTGVCSHDFTIAKKTVTASVTVDGTHIYNGKAIEPSVITVKDGEDVIPDTEYTTAFKDNTDAGTATVLITNADGGNYIVNGTGTFEILQAHITVRPKSISKVYGDKPVYALESDSELITEEQLADFTRSTRFTSDGTKEDADVLPGGYEITAVLTENETKNLLLSVSGTGILTVVPKKLTVTVNDVSRVYGDPNPELSVSYDGFIEGEDETVLGGALVLAYHESINETAEVRTHYGVTTASGLTSDNYAITYVPGNVTITKILVSVRAGSARRNYLSAVFDKPLENLTAANFAVTDENGNPVAITSAAALDGNKTYSLKGSFEVGKKYTVKVVLHGATVDATHQMTTDTFTITPIRTSGSGGSSGSGTSGGSTVTTCTVTFETNGASKLADQTVAKGSVLQEPTSPTKDGFTFAGWYTDKELQMKYDFSAKVQANLTLYAAWTETEKDNTENQIILTIGEKEALVFGKIKTNDVAPKIVNDRTMLPARFVAENLGADVSWNEEQELVTIKGKNSKTNKDVTILIYIGSDIAYVDGKRFKLDSPAFVENDRTYTPIRFISEELGASVEWIEEEQKVVITK